jgi:hypothetical protein
MAEALQPRLVIVLETSDGDDRIATFQLPSNDAINDVDGGPNIAKAIAFINEYKASEGLNPPV